MKLFPRVLAVGLMVLGTAVACSPNKSGNNKIDAKAILDRQGPSQEKAEQIAQAGEKLVYDGAPVEAAALFDVALGLDQNNVRARFYKAIINVSLASKGILTRVQPIVQRLSREDQNKFQESVDQIPAGANKAFLQAAGQPINNEADVQALVSDVQNRMRSLRKTLQDLSNTTFVAHVQVKQNVEGCQVATSSENVYSVTNCQTAEQKDVTFDYADFQALRLGVLAMQIYYTSWNAYNLTGAETVYNKLANRPHLTDKVIIDTINQEASLGKILDAKPLKEILELGAEGLEAVKYSINNQEKVCPKGITAPGSRPGHLTEDGICPDEGVIASIPYLEAILRGPVALVFTSYKQVEHEECYNWSYNQTTHQYECSSDYTWTQQVPAGRYATYGDATTVLNGSLTDIKSILPNQFSACGAATNLPEQSIGGLLPHKDAVRIVKTTNPNFLSGSCDVGPADYVQVKLHR